MFKPVAAKVDFVKLEKNWLFWWYQSGLAQKYLHKNDQAKKRFFFLDGPITANNPMGVHHAWGRTYKDLWQRYKNMRGFRQRFQNGFDNQGLWIEVEVEKELGFKSKKEIEKFGVEKFVEKCKERTLKYAQIQTEQSKRLGYFMDWDNSYYTLSAENNYTIWHFLKKCFGQGLLYKGEDTVPWCPRCGTAISQHEILTEEYQEIVHQTIFIKYPIRGQKNMSFLAWTTSPWTLPANIALAVNPDLIYGIFQNQQSGEKVIFLKDLALKVLGENSSWQKIEEYPGRKLAGWFYQSPFDDLAINQKIAREKSEKFHLVVLERELVTADEGSGIVHLSPGSGPEDYQVAKREGLPTAPVIDEAGNYLADYGFLAGQNAKDNPGLIFDYLKVLEQGRYFYKLEPYAHRYPVCWRCKTELVWRLVKEWYIKMDFLRRPMRQVTEKINWLPTWGKNQELDWLRNMHDWLISKKRYWGLALPIWECSCGFFEVIGSCEELKKKAVSGWTKFVGHSPHRPWLDEVKIRCPKCGQEISRIKDVGNPWLDAGIVAYSTLTEPKTGKVSYLTDKKYWREWFPADFITECFPGQFKNWFYSLLAMSTVLEKTLPCKTILGHALVRDEKGEEMHKSKGNAIWFDEAAEKMGVDVMRWLYVTQNPELNLNFGYRIADETRRRFHLILWNIYNFFISRANADGWQKVGEPVRSNHVFDQWVMSLLNKLVKQGTVALDRYDAFTASHALENFVIDLSTWYVRRSRERGDKNNFYWTLWEVLATLAQLLAPFIPFLAEEIYYNLTDGESVHLASWPKVSKIDEKLLSEMAMVRKICELGNAERKQAGIRVRQPLNQLRIANCELRINSGLIDLIKEELNVKKVVFIKKEGGLAVELDTEITRQLREEGKTRDLIRKIQELRKKAKLDLTRQIVVKGPWFPTRPELVNYLKRKVLAKELVKADELCLV